MRISDKKAATLLTLLVLPYFLNDFYMMCSNNLSMAEFWMLDVMVYALLPLCCLVICTKRGLLDISMIGFPLRFSGNRLLCGAVFGLAYVLIMETALDPLLASLFPPWLFSGYAFPSEEPQRALLILYAALSAGILEEIIFRGAAITTLERFISSNKGVILCSSALFACIHWSSGWGAIIGTFLFAYPVSVYFQRTRDLAAPITAHILVDLLYFSYKPYLLALF